MPANEKVNEGILESIREALLKNQEEEAVSCGLCGRTRYPLPREFRLEPSRTSPGLSEWRVHSWYEVDSGWVRFSLNSQSGFIEYCPYCVSENAFLREQVVNAKTKGAPA